MDAVVDMDMDVIVDVVDRVIGSGLAWCVVRGARWW